MSNINKTTRENYPVKIHPIYNLKNFMKIVDKHITPEDLKKPVHPVYNLKNFMKIVDKVLEKEKIKQQNGEEWITVKGNHIKLKDGETKEEAIKRFIEEKEKAVAKHAGKSKIKSRAGITLPRKEYAYVMGELRTNISKDEKTKGWTSRTLGKYKYTVIIYDNEDDYDLKIVEREKNDD